MSAQQPPCAQVGRWSPNVICVTQKYGKVLPQFTEIEWLLCTYVLALLGIFWLLVCNPQLCAIAGFEVGMFDQQRPTIVLCTGPWDRGCCCCHWKGKLIVKRRVILRHKNTYICFQKFQFVTGTVCLPRFSKGAFAQYPLYQE